MEDQLDQEFIEEAKELFEQAEEALLEMEQGKNFQESYKTCMRCLHTLKGAFGMFGFGELENATHHFEDLVKGQSENNEITKNLVDYLLEGLDNLKTSLNHGAKFSYKLLTEQQIQNAVPKKDDISQGSSKQAKNDQTQEKPFITQPVIKKDPPLGLAFVVEDEDDIRKYIVKKLNQENIETRDFDDALEALREVEKLNPDIIITDLKMPKMNGMEWTSSPSLEKTTLKCRLLSLLPTLPRKCVLKL